MKKFVFLLISSLLLCYACSNDDKDGYKTYPVTVQLAYPADSELGVSEGVQVKLTNAGGTAYDATTDASGKALFNVPVGIYEASATDKRSESGYAFLFNGIKSNIVVTEAWTGSETVELALKKSKSGQILIKELYVGGCAKNDGSGAFAFDKYVVLYNNSDQEADIKNFCLGMAMPYNSNANNKNYGADGKLTYEKEGFIPAGCAIWSFPKTFKLAPGKQLVVAMNGALDHTKTYTNSVNLGKADYYCMYDIADFSHTSYYPSPSELIPTSHYLSAEKYGQASGWPLSMVSPAFFIFHIEKSTPAQYAGDAKNLWHDGGVQSPANACIKVPVEWVLDGIEVYTTISDKNKKRLTSTIDAGYTFLTNKIGHTSYRNVDKAATEALEENKGKLVYGYNKGVGNSTDPSGIDAEASMKAGARIIYMDTNNSTNDFHERSHASLRD